MCHSRACDLKPTFNTSAIIGSLSNNCSILRKYFRDNDIGKVLAYRFHPVGMQVIETFKLQGNKNDVPFLDRETFNEETFESAFSPETKYAYIDYKNHVTKVTFKGKDNETNT